MDTNLFITSLVNIPMGIVAVVLVTEFFKKIPLINKIDAEYIKILTSIFYIVATGGAIEISGNGVMTLIFKIAVLTLASGILYDTTLSKIKAKLGSVESTGDLESNSITPVSTEVIDSLEDSVDSIVEIKENKMDPTDVPATDNVNTESK